MSVAARSTSFRRWARGTPVARDGVVVAALALVARLLAVAWGASRFPPAEDGRFYHVVATRIAEGHGYTWLWPDGAVTYAAHYPVGYPATIGALYAVIGPHPAVAMTFNAVIGVLAVYAVHRVASTRASRAGALAASGLAALHPALLFYTPALMTEGVVAAFLALAAWVATAARQRGWSGPRAGSAVGLAFGLAVLTRPQVLLIAPLFGWVAAPERARSRIVSALLATSVAVACCAPWTLRNCARIERCVFVSANGGWNLLIGAAERATGAWVPIENVGFPEECRTVFGEADKDACFRDAALSTIAREPGRWIGLMPKKLAATFDFGGAPGWYLHASNPKSFDKSAKLALGALETVWQRLVLLGALAALALAAGPRRRVRAVLALFSAVWALQQSAWGAYLGLVLIALLLGRRLLREGVVVMAVGTVLGTAVTHAVFFGSGRYSMVCYPLLAALAGAALTTIAGARDTDAKESPDAADRD